MAKSIALAADASLLASLLLSYIPAVCAFVAPRHQGASAAIIDRLSHSRALTPECGNHNPPRYGSRFSYRKIGRSEGQAKAGVAPTRDGPRVAQPKTPHRLR